MITDPVDHVSASLTIQVRPLRYSVFVFVSCYFRWTFVFVRQFSANIGRFSLYFLVFYWEIEATSIRGPSHPSNKLRNQDTYKKYTRKHQEKYRNIPRTSVSIAPPKSWQPKGLTPEPRLWTPLPLAAAGGHMISYRSHMISYGTHGTHMIS